MKKAILIGLIVGITLMFGSQAMAGGKPGPGLSAPVWSEPCAFVDGDSVYFNWEDLSGAGKYSVDVDVLITGTWEAGVIVHLSFGTSDRTDGGLMGDSYLDVPFTNFVYDYDLDGTPNQLFGDARAKVKGLNPPTKGYTSQNNPFSGWCSFTLPTLP
jgi:hypothetical protein